MTELQGRLLRQIENGTRTIGGKFHASLKALERKGYIKIVERKECTTHIKDFKEYVIHGQYRMGEILKKVKYVVYIVEPVE